MEIGLLIIVVVLLGFFGWWSAGKLGAKQKIIHAKGIRTRQTRDNAPSENEPASPKLIPKPLKSERGDRVLVSNPPRTVSNDNNGIAELIRQQEQTNRHLQKLISDFFWFRIAIIGFLLFGGIGVVFK